MDSHIILPTCGVVGDTVDSPIPKYGGVNQWGGEIGKQ